MKNFERLTDGESSDWETLSEFDRATSLSEGELRAIRKAIRNIQGGNQMLEAFATPINRNADTLGIKPDPKLLNTANPMVEQMRQEACQPYL
jgi:hypothetical protein